MDLSVTGMIGPRLRRQWSDEGVEQLRILPRRSWKVVAAAAGLLLVKDVQVFSHAFKHHGWFENAMMAVWIGILLLWFIAAVGEFIGTEVLSVFRGELIVSRGIGPLRRTFRFPVNEIAGMESSDPTDEKGKRHLQHIYGKSDRGAVRFEFRGSSVYLAEWLSEAEGDQIVRWLKPRMPSKATQPLRYDEPSGGTANLKL